MHANTVAIVDLDWGIAATFDGMHFTADPSGVLQLESSNVNSTNPPGGNTKTWEDAVASCANVGKRMSGISALKALFGITGTTPSGLTASNYWSATEHPTSSYASYLVSMTDGVVAAPVKTGLRYVRCGS